MKRKKFNIQKGFTLVELLIVVGIIGVLATLLMANFIGVRQRARDAQRKSDLRQLQSALEIYRSDQGTYKAAAGTTLGACLSSLQAGSPAVTYMSKIPCDPGGSYNSGSYFYSSTGSTYTLGACLENSADSQGTNTSPGGVGCSSGIYYTVINP